MSKFNSGDTVFIPVSRIGGMKNHHASFYATRIVEVGDRRVKFELPKGTISEWIGSSLVQKNIGILILEIGDLETETNLLDPLAKSVLQYCRLLISDEYVNFYKIRSLDELRIIWDKEKKLYSHVIFVGHGSKTGVIFPNAVITIPEEFSTVLVGDTAEKKVFISLCCQTGYKNMGGKFSEIVTVCSHFIAPFHSIHGAEASQFVQTFLAFHLLKGVTVKVAFNNARKTPNGATFRLWKDGKLKAGVK